MGTKTKHGKETRPIVFGTDVSCMRIVSSPELICESREAETDMEHDKESIKRRPVSLMLARLGMHNNSVPAREAAH